MPLFDNIIAFFLLVEVPQSFARKKWNKIEFLHFFIH